MLPLLPEGRRIRRIVYGAKIQTFSLTTKFMIKVFEITLPIKKESRIRNLWKRWLTKRTSSETQASPKQHEEAVCRPFDALLHLLSLQLYPSPLVYLLLLTIGSTPSRLLETRPLPKGKSGWLTIVKKEGSKGEEVSLKLLTTPTSGGQLLQVYSRAPLSLPRIAIISWAFPFS